MNNLLFLFIFTLGIHFVGDFYLQWNRLSEKKVVFDNNLKIRSKSFLFLLLHSLIYSCCYFLLLLVCDLPSTIIFVLCVFLWHFIVDLFSPLIEIKLCKTIRFLINQILHILFLVFALLLLESHFRQISSSDQNLVIFISIILFLVKPSKIFIGYFIDDIFKSYKRNKKEDIVGNKDVAGVDECAKDSSNNLETNLIETDSKLHTKASSKIIHFDTGSIIGICERLIIFALSIFNALTAMALIIAAKTWARSKDLSDEQFRVKYILGTFLSILLALVGSLAFYFLCIL